MIEVVGVKFKENGKIYFFSSENLKLKNNITIIVDTERGKQFAKVTKESHFIEQSKITKPLNKIIRIANKKDYYQHLTNKKDSEKALKVCRKLVEENKLNMRIIDANYNFNREQLIFQFVADSRIDFRELAKQLASIYKTRIELRQIGVRDKAKEIGGIGICGRGLCCFNFLNDLDSVSINMAKNQNLSLNPTKINGACGRLLCCLKYEDDCYKECKKGIPEIGGIVHTEYGTGKVISNDILLRKYKVNIEGKGIFEVSCEEKQCCK